MAGECANRRLLVVDDDRDSAETLAMLIQRRFPEVAVTIAFDAKAGVKLAAQERPSVIILDIEMPVLDGFGAAAEIRSLQDGPAPLLIAASGNIERLSVAVSSGLFDHALPKPLDLSKLVRLFESESAAGPQS